MRETTLAPFRKQLNDWLDRLQLPRPAALRRALTDDAVLSTDLPKIVDKTTLVQLIEALTAQGWSVWEQNGWLLLDRPIKARVITGGIMPDGEPGCCISLLERHRNDLQFAPIWIRRLVKAQEMGTPAMEKTCRALHDQLAECLRRHQPMPDVLDILRAMFCNEGDQI